MKKINLLLLGLFLIACSNQDRNDMDANNAAGTGDPDLARHVSGVYLLSTDYHYQEPCNYLPEEFVKNLFQLGENVELDKHSELHSCELRWGPNKIGFYLESDKPFESVYQSEYHFNKLFEPGANAGADQGTAAKPTPFGPAPQGTNSELPANEESASTEQDSARGDASAPLGGITKPAPPLVDPAQNTATGEAVKEVGDKAIWEPGKKALHVLHNNHVFSVVVQMPGNSAKLKQSSIGLAKLVIYYISENRDPRD